jgi:hypothetical protein
MVVLGEKEWVALGEQGLGRTIGGSDGELFVQA